MVRYPSADSVFVPEPGINPDLLVLFVPGWNGNIVHGTFKQIRELRNYGVLPEFSFKEVKYVQHIPSK